jgi:hypothetical protein
MLELASLPTIFCGVTLIIVVVTAKACEPKLAATIPTEKANKFL